MKKQESTQRPTEDQTKRDHLAKIALSVQLTPEALKAIAVRAVKRHERELLNHAHDDTFRTPY